MLEILKKKSRKTYLTRAIIAAVIAVALLALTKFAIFDVITGPTRMDITADPDQYAEKYVTIDVGNFLTDYVEHTTTTTNKKTGSRSTRIDGNSYIVFQSVDDYEKNSSIWYFYSIYMKESDQSKMYARIDDTWEYWQDETGRVAPPEALTVKGTWTKLDSQLEKYYRETLEDMGVEETEYDYIYYYTLDTSRLGGQQVSFFWTLMGAVLFLVLYCIFNVIGAIGNGYAGEINKYLQKNGNISMANLDADFSRAHPIGKNVWVGKSWTVYMAGPKAKILANKELIWGYYYRRTGRYSVSQMRLFTAGKKMFGINLSEKETHEALQYYMQEQPQMVIGYKADLEKMYNKQFTEFLNLKYNPAMQAAQMDAYYGGYGNDGGSAAQNYGSDAGDGIHVD